MLTPSRFLPTICIFLIVASCAPSPPDAPSLTIFAAASLRDVAREIATECARREAIDIVFNFAGSGTLARQIEAAPGADLFLSADTLWIDHLERAGRIAPDGSRKIFSNRLVIIARTDAAASLIDVHDLPAAAFRSLALADPDSVPAGRYARDALQSLGLWDALAPRVVPALDVRAALALVESDPDFVGIVYKTDALSSSKVTVLAELAAPGVDVVYAAAVIAGPREEMARRFLDFLSGPRGREIVDRHGFLPID